MTASPQVVLGIDYGDRHIGTASGSTLTGSAHPLARLRTPRDDASWALLDALVDEWRPAALILGLPLDLDGKDQPVTGRARAFARVLDKRYDLPVYLHDERYSTREARGRAREAGLDPARNDAFAAAIIVEGWLQSGAWAPERSPRP